MCQENKNKKFLTLYSFCIALYCVQIVYSFILFILFILLVIIFAFIVIFYGNLLPPPPYTCTKLDITQVL